MVDLVDFRPGDRVLEPCLGGGVIFDKFPSTCEKLWCEIDKGRDFFDFHEKVDVIITNPPFSMWKEMADHMLELQPRVIVLLMGSMNYQIGLHTKFLNAQYQITKIHSTWWNRVMYHTTFILHLEKVQGDFPAALTFDVRLHKTAGAETAPDV